MEWREARLLPPIEPTLTNVALDRVRSGLSALRRGADSIAAGDSECDEGSSAHSGKGDCNKAARPSQGAAAF